MTCVSLLLFFCSSLALVSVFPAPSFSGSACCLFGLCNFALLLFSWSAGLNVVLERTCPQRAVVVVVVMVGRGGGGVEKVMSGMGGGAGEGARVLNAGRGGGQRRGHSARHSVPSGCLRCLAFALFRSARPRIAGSLKGKGTFTL